MPITMIYALSPSLLGMFISVQ